MNIKKLFKYFALKMLMLSIPIFILLPESCNAFSKEFKNLNN